jgi:hypothetical protein
VKNRLWIIGFLALLATGAALLVRHTKQLKGSALHFVEAESELKNFEAFPPEIPSGEFDEADLFS